MTNCCISLAKGLRVLLLTQCLGWRTSTRLRDEAIPPFILASYQLQTRAFVRNTFAFVVLRAPAPILRQ